MNSSDAKLDHTLDTASHLHRSAVRLFRMLRAFRPEKGLSLAKFSVLGRLYQDGVTTATELAAYLRIQPQSITRLLADLEQSQLIVRRPDEADRRKSLIEVTAKGSRLLLEEVHEQQMHLARIIDESLTCSEQEMLRLAAGLMDRLTAETEARIVNEKRSKQTATTAGHIKVNPKK